MKEASLECRGEEELELFLLCTDWLRRADRACAGSSESERRGLSVDLEREAEFME